MKNIIQRIITLLVILFMFSVCKNCAGSYIKGSDQEYISNLQKMISENNVAQAIYYPEYTEKTIKVMKVPVKTYEFNYFFFVNNKQYEGTRSLSKLPEANNFTIYYLSNNPNINSANPEDELKAELEKENSKSDLYWAIGWGVLGLFTLIGFVVDIKESMSNKTPKNK